MMSLEILGLDRWRRRVDRWPVAIRDAVTDVVHDDMRDVARDMPRRASAYGRIAAKAASTVDLALTVDAAVVAAGKSGNALGQELVMGAEFGGRRKPKHAYVTRSRRGRAYIARRRTTRQFKMHLGNRGYWFFPTLRLDLRGIFSRMQRAMMTAMER